MVRDTFTITLRAEPCAQGKARQTAHEFLARHEAGDWGDLSVSDKRANDAALIDGSRILSAYRTTQGVTLWIITEATGDNGRRASTCIMLPEEY